MPRTSSERDGQEGKKKKISVESMDGLLCQEIKEKEAKQKNKKRK